MYRSRKKPMPDQRYVPYLLPRQMTRGGNREKMSTDLASLLNTDMYLNPSGNFVNWGWLSVPEMQKGIKNLELKHVSVKVCTVSFCDLPHIPNGDSVVFLVRKHYIVVSHVCHKLVFFDPLSQPACTYFGNSMPQLAPVNMHVQTLDSPLCGNFVLFFLHVLYSLLDRSRFNKNTVLEGIRGLLNQFLYSSPQPIHFNNTLLEYFTIDHHIGEEFNSQLYKRFHRYETLLSNKSKKTKCSCK
ncbi:TPA_asm: LO8 [Tilapia adomavirus 1]|uniref:LO8 n=1 Tax=Tilapia adomavirus 1 TaxID=2597803 RepID=A0A5H3CUI1_9VIRU|nr:TPA_asm: LO8 [Tilapia adomavirus 1]